MSSQYTASVPSGDLVKPEIVAFYEKFYEISDTASAHEQYADSFTKDGKLIMASNETTGREGTLVLLARSVRSPMSLRNRTCIVKMRHGMWEKVSKRSHKPAKIFTFGKDSGEVMLYGTVDYILKDGKSATDIEWAARAHLVKEDGRLRMDFYQVYLVSTSMALTYVCFERWTDRGKGYRRDGCESQIEFHGLSRCL
jgi:hypothetical protein